MSQTIKQFLKVIKDEFGEEILIIPELNPNTYDDSLEIVSTGSSLIDKTLGIDGLPFGRIVEISGTEASGKTTLALSVIAQAQAKDYRCAYIDTEQALERSRTEHLGVNFDKLAISQPSNAEEALDLLELLIVSGHFRVVVLDSVAALVPKAEIEGGMEDSLIGVQARLMGKILRKIASPAKKNNVLVIFINQIRYKIGGFTPFPQEVTPGGNALKFYASVRIDMRRVNSPKNKGGVSVHKVTVRKNKLAVPMRTCQVTLGLTGFRD